MALPSSTISRDSADPADAARSYRPALTLLASLFFMWGFITVINGTLLPNCAACSTSAISGRR